MAKLLSLRIGRENDTYISGVYSLTEITRTPLPADQSEP
jgi:hypothetical protein